MSTTDYAEQSSPPQMSAAKRWTALGVLSLALAAIAIDGTILNVALPQITQDLAPTATQQLWMIDIYSLILAGLLVPMSAVADRFGRKRVLLAGFLVFAGASLAVLAAETASAVIVVRALLGIGGAMIMPTTLSMIRVIFTDPKERATAIGVWASVSAAGAALGPVVGGILLENISWHAAFLINVPLMAIVFVASIFLLPEYRNPTPPAWDLAGTLASIAGMVALVWSIKHFADKGFDNAAGWAALAAAVVLMAWFVRRCLRRPDPMLDLRLFQRRPFVAGILAALAAVFALGALLLLVAQGFQLVEGRSPLEAGIAMVPAAVAMGLAAPIAPALASRIGTRTVLAGGLVIAGLGFLIFFVAPDPLSFGWVVTALVLLGGGGGSLAVGSAMMMAATPQEKAGNAAALEEVAYELGTVLGVATLGSVAAAVYGSHLRDSAPTALDDSQIEAATESLGGAMEVAAQTGSTELVASASDAFVDSLAQTGLVGFGILLVAAVTTAVLVPRNFKITEQSH